MFGSDADDIQAPTGIYASPDGAVWFTSIGNDRVGRVHPATGQVETFADPAGDVRLPANIIPAADGRLWFTCLGAGMLAAIDPNAEDPAGTIVGYRHSDLDKPVAIKQALDGRLWFTDRGGPGGVGSIDPCADDPSATLRIYRSPSIAGPSALFADPGGAIWWVNAADSTIGRLEPDRAEAAAQDITTLAVPAAFGSPRAWARDPAGRLWLTTRAPAGVLSFDPAAADPATTFTWFTHDALVAPDGIWCAADGSLWLADTEAEDIVRFEPGSAGRQAWSWWGAPPVVSGPFDIKGGPGGDHSMWFTNKTGNTIGRIAT